MRTVISASGAIIKGNKLLLIKRSMSEHRFPGCWALPGGKQDSEELPKDTARREVKEEIGLDFEPKELLGKYAFEVGDLKGTGYVFIGEASGNTSINEEEISEFKWLNYKETKDLDFAFHYKKAIEDIHKKGLF